MEISSTFLNITITGFAVIILTTMYICVYLFSSDKKFINEIKWKTIVSILLFVIIQILKYTL
jgi:hypothetical protein